MKKNIYLLIAVFITLCVCNMSTHAQGVTFRNANAKLTNTNNHSGCAMTVCDWNSDGLDDIIHLDQDHNCYVDVQTTNAQFARVNLGDFGSGFGAWAMSVADFDRNGYLDIVAGEGNSGGVLMTNNTGTGATLTMFASSNFFWQNITCADFNNDGWIDVFGCDDNAAAKMYLNDGTGNLSPSTYIDFNVYPGLSVGGDPYDSGNYGSAWTDFDNDGDLDLFIAHCRQSASSASDERRRDRLFVNDGTYHFTEQAAAYGIEATVFNQTWTSSFGDIDNDGDLDVVFANHDTPSQIFLNDGTGHYTDISSTAGFDIVSIFPLECILEDFNNDGYLDILGTGDDARLFFNNGNNTFTLVNNPFDANGMQSFGIGDLNHDGFVDIYAGYATGYNSPTSVDDVIWMNEKNSNHWITFNLKGTVSNHNALGARVTLYTAMGTQIREVRSGESYGTCNSFECHFGLGASTVIDSAVIWFPSGITETIVNPDADQFVTVIEGDCVSPSSAITINGPLLLCPGTTLTLTAAPGYNYLWSDNTTSQVNTITATGEYNVVVSASGNNCSAISQNVSVIVNPDNTPTVTTSASTEICPGGSVDLFGPSGQSSYLWSDGSTTQNITVTQSGVYDLTVPGLCQSFTSLPTTVTMHTPGISSVQDDSTCIGGSANLGATGTGIIDWFDAASGGTLLYSGSPFPSPSVFSNTVFYAQDRFTTNYPITYAGPVNNGIGNGGYSTNSPSTRYLTFDALQAISLNSVWVFAQSAGNRTIELRNSANGVLQSKTVNIPTGGSTVALNFNIAAGNNYRLGVANGSTVGLYRNNSGVSYPYSVAGLINITGSDAGSAYYYYFYNWEVSKQNVECIAATRSAVNAFVDPSCTVGIAQHANNNLLNIFPNPASNFVQVDLKYAAKGTVEISINDLAGKTVQSNNFINDNGNFMQTIDVSNLAKGFYMINVKLGNQQWERKITIQ